MNLNRDRPLTIPASFFSLAMVVVIGQTVIACAAQPEPKKQTAAPSAPGLRVGEERREAARGITFRPEAAKLPPLPSDIGAVSSDTAARISPQDRQSMEESFMDAYLDAVFRGDALEGTLGGDRVHGWPPARPAAYAQNWRSSSPAPNSWGLSALVLAVHPLEGDRVSVVRGAVLDFYGQGKGVGSANGIAGYGAPLSDEFAYEGGVAQRFELGIIAMAAGGSLSFLVGEPGSVSKAPGESVGLLNATATGGLNAESVASAFRSSWTTAVNRGLPPAEADGPVQSILFPVAEEQGVVPADAGQPKESVRVESVLLQTYGDSAWALVLPVGKGIGKRARLLAPPFLDRILVEGSWETGFAAYGAPLSDPFPRSGKTIQRFSAGWMETE